MKYKTISKVIGVDRIQNKSIHNRGINYSVQTLIYAFSDCGKPCRWLHLHRASQPQHDHEKIKIKRACATDEDSILKPKCFPSTAFNIFDEKTQGILKAERPLKNHIELSISK